MIHNRGLTSCLPDFILTEEQRKDMSLEHQLKDLNEKLEMTQAIRHRGKYIEVLFNAIRMNTDQFVLGLVTSQDWGKPGLSISINVYDLANDSCQELNV